MDRFQAVFWWIVALFVAAFIFGPNAHAKPVSPCDTLRTVEQMADAIVANRPDSVDVHTMRDLITDTREILCAQEDGEAKR